MAPTLLPGLNSAEQQLTPYQLRNASPQQLQRLRQLQQMQQQQGPGNSPIGQLIGAFLPGGQNLLGGGGNANPQNNLNNQNTGPLARLLGLSPQQQPANPYLNNNVNNNNNAAGLNNYGQPISNQTPKANLRSSNDDTSNNSNDNNSNDDSSNNNGDNGEENSDDDSSGDSSGDNGNQPQQDPSNDPDIQQFNNLQGNENFPGDLFPKGILSENDLKVIKNNLFF